VDVPVELAVERALELDDGVLLHDLDDRRVLGLVAVVGQPQRPQALVDELRGHLVGGAQLPRMDDFPAGGRLPREPAPVGDAVLHPGVHEPGEDAPVARHRVVVGKGLVDVPVHGDESQVVEHRLRIEVRLADLRGAALGRVEEAEDLAFLVGGQQRQEQRQDHGSWFLTPSLRCWR
jgi:hypothetical protein